MNKNKRIEFTLRMLNALSTVFTDPEDPNHIEFKDIEENFEEFLDAALTLVPTKIYSAYTGEDSDGLDMHFSAIRIISTNDDYDITSGEASESGSN